VLALVLAVAALAAPAPCAAGTTRPLGDASFALAAAVVRPTTAYDRPGGRPLARFGLLNVNGFPTVFSAVGELVDRRCRATWLHVELPVRPNGLTGWVRAADVERVRVRTRIVVDLSARRLALYRGGRLVLTAAVAVGSPATPTPTGRFYVNQRLLPRDPTGPFGPAALGVSAFSPVLTGWAQGGPIGIHGTNEPWSIGRAVSNGCIRMRNGVIRRLFARTLAGTPVVIRP
jgi:lipoprotein-anchoring transpeptidase ErfK/SrfK